MKTIIISVLLIVLFPFANIAESNKNLKQVIRGVVVDKQTQMPLPGANIALLNSVSPIGTTTNINGEFRLENIPTGRQDIQVSFIGYHHYFAKNLMVNSAKEIVLFIEMEEKVETTEEVVVVGNYRKDLALNKMASVSARTFTVEEADRYAGSRADVARMAMNFAGVSGLNDQRNDIIVRGNTPSGILWRLEDVDIPNPNHFAATGTTGGPVGMINNNTLRNSDFFTGAFPAEYANGFSGVFDLNMREGNNENYEFMGQVGFNGFELGAEGPFKKGSKSSFLINYRYSTLQIFDLFGISFGTAGIPKYQDLSFKLNFPTKKGKISWFGLAGNSSISMLDSEEKSTDLYTNDGMDLINGSKSAVTGINYTRFHNENAYSKFILSYVFQNATTSLDTLDLNDLPNPYYREDNTGNKMTFKYILNRKLNRKLSNRSGFTIDRNGYQLNTKYWDNGWINLLDNSKSVLDGVNLYRANTQFVYKFSDRFQIKPGLSVLHFGLTEDFAIEPRFGANWKVGYKTSLNFGYGLHSKTQSLATYFLESEDIGGNIVLSNKDLDFTKAHHLILGADILLGEHLRFKTEAYYQYLYNVPVENEISSYSVLNEGAQWGLNTRDFLVNEGEGWNYGVEFTLEKFYHNNYYFLVTTSIFDSKYTGSDGVKRNTAFNGKFVFNTLAGREFKLKKNSTLVFDVKVTWAGGKHYTPIDLEASQKSTSPYSTEYHENLAYSQQFSNYFKADVKIGFRKDGKKVSQVWEFYVENVTNHKNPLSQLYSKNKGEIETVNQLGFFPLFNYKIYF